MVDDWYERLGLNEIIGRHKSKGIALDALVRGMLVDQLGDNFSILQASEGLNRKEILDHYGIRGFNPKTLYRAVELLGRNRERIIRELQDNVLELLGRPRTDVLLDWTSIVYYGDMAKLAKYGYSRDHNPGERQLTLGAAQLAPGSLVVFDRGANDKNNLERIELNRNDYLTAKKLNVSDDAVFQTFDPERWERIDVDTGVYALKRVFPSRVNYYFFSQK